MESSQRLNLAIKTLAASIFLGFAGNLFLGDVPIGLGFSVYALVVLLTGAYLYRNRLEPLGRGALALVPAALLFAGLFAWRDAEALKLLNGVSLAAIVALIALKGRGGDLRVATIRDYPFRLLERWILFLGDFFVLVRLEGQWKALFGERAGAAMGGIGRGLLIAAPVVLAFGALFASADAAFGELLTRMFTWDLDALWSHVIVFALCAWLSGGFLRRIFLAVEPPPKPETARPATGAVEFLVVLVSVNVVFVLFLATQIPYLFGGAAVVQATADLPLSEYARRGFFELVAVAGLALVLLLGVYEALRHDRERTMRMYVPAAAILVALVGVVMTSAAQRMQLYVEGFGISEQRLYVFATLAWLAFVFFWFSLTVLRGRGDRFAFGALASFLLATVVLNVVNPDATVVRINTSRPEAVDAGYLATLSLDAAPELRRALPRLPDGQREIVRQGLERNLAEARARDWRSLNVSALQAISSEPPGAALARR
jgi:hypothetical protein